MVERQAEAAKPMGNGVLPAAAAAKGVWAKLGHRIGPSEGFNQCEDVAAWS